MGKVVDSLVDLSKYLPEIKKPEKEISFKQKLMWTLIALLLFFVMAKIAVVGLAPVAQNDDLKAAQMLLASEFGTLITAGIGPIVMASIFLQLLLGAQLIPLDLGSMEGRAKFQALQKLFAVVLCFAEGLIYVSGGVIVPLEGMFIPVVLQIALGSLALLYLDELVSKYGIGSGISLFIAAGVSVQLFWLTFSIPIGLVTEGGLLWKFFIVSPGEWLILLPLLGVIAIFLVVVFAEGMHVNIPITFGYRGTGGRYPVKFLYVSNMPVILAMALFINFRIWAMLTKNVPILNTIMDGIAWAVRIPSIDNLSLLQGIIIQGELNALVIGALIQAAVFMILLIIACVVFGWFWVQMGNQGTGAVAAQLERAGMQIPGFRRDKRVIEKVLERYIPQVTILGSIFVALLAGGGDLVLAGVTSGTGILLTVGIVYRFYEEIAKTQQEALSRILGKMA